MKDIKPKDPKASQPSEKGKDVERLSQRKTRAVARRPLARKSRRVSKATHI
jgi:hypothetical protein